MTPNPQSNSRKLPARYIGVVQPFILSIFMSFIVSGVATLKNVGLSPDFFLSWMSAWGISWIIAFPTLLIVFPMVRRIVGMIVDLPPSAKIAAQENIRSPCSSMICRPFEIADEAAWSAEGNRSARMKVWIFVSPPIISCECCPVSCLWLAYHPRTTRMSFCKNRLVYVHS